jgi:hypothetical protein
MALLLRVHMDALPWPLLLRNNAAQCTSTQNPNTSRRMRAIPPLLLTQMPATSPLMQSCAPLLVALLAPQKSAAPPHHAAPLPSAHTDNTSNMRSCGDSADRTVSAANAEWLSCQSNTPNARSPPSTHPKKR